MKRDAAFEAMRAGPYRLDHALPVNRLDVARRQREASRRRATSDNVWVADDEIAAACCAVASRSTDSGSELSSPAAVALLDAKEAAIGDGGAHHLGADDVVRFERHAIDGALE